MTDHLPRLAVITDVPVERSCAGSLLLYRLLADYPAGRLRVVGGNLHKPDPGRRLPGVVYRKLTYAPTRLLSSRLHSLVALGMLGMPWVRVAALRRSLREFRPEAILTVSEQYLWLAAALLARRLRIPLHLIGHDDWLTYAPVPAFMGSIAHRLFGRIYRQASGRFCVSPFMESDYRARYGVAGEVLFPSRGPDGPEPRVRVRPRVTGGFTVALAGSFAGESSTEQLVRLASALSNLGGRLVIYGKRPLGRLGSLPNVRHGGFLAASVLGETIGATADLLFVPMMFEQAARQTVMTAFPSKLADYTAIGLPIMICGPDYCSAVRWAMQWPGVARVVCEPTRESFTTVLSDLAADYDQRLALARRAVEVGNRCFSLQAARSQLYDALTRDNRRAPATA